MKLDQALTDAIAVLESNGHSFAVVGGLAASVRGEVRFTRDIDVAVSVRGDDDAEQVVHDFVQSGWEVLATVEQDAQKRMATARLRGPSKVICDLIFATTGIEAEIVAAAEPVMILKSLVVPTATAEALLAMKVLSATERRIRDIADIQAILAHSTTIDTALVESLLKLIEERGYARGQDLLQKWGQFRSQGESR